MIWEEKRILYVLIPNLKFESPHKCPQNRYITVVIKFSDGYELNEDKFLQLDFLLLREWALYLIFWKDLSFFFNLPSQKIIQLLDKR